MVIIASAVAQRLQQPQQHGNRNGKRKKKNNQPAVIVVRAEKRVIGVMVQRAECEAARKHWLLHMHDGATAAAKQEQGRSTYQQRIATRTPSGNYSKSS